jgi:transcriptional regulator with XRE-family HTH domain
MTLGTHAQDFWDGFSKNDQQEIQNRADARIAEYRNLQEIRKAAGLTQSKMSEELNISQGNLSRLERNSDMLLSTLQTYIKAIGGKLNLTVELPNKPPIILTGLGDLIERPLPTQSEVH